MIADVVVYHPLVTHYLKFASTTAGRDKLLRTIQYFARFYSWFVHRRAAAATALTSLTHTTATALAPAKSATGKPELATTAASAAPWDTAKKQLGVARKLLLIGKNIEHFRAAAVAFDARGTDPVVRWTTVGRQLAYCAYLSADSATVLDATGIRRWAGAKRLQHEAYRFWTAGLACSIVCQLYTLLRLNERDALVDRKEGEGAVEGKRIAA